MPIVNFVNENKSIEVKNGTSLARAARNVGIYLETPCNGAGSCGKCKVKVNDINSVKLIQSIKKPTAVETAQGIVLACHSLVVADVSVYTLVDNNKSETMQILSNGETRSFDTEPSYFKEYKNGKTYVCNESGLLGDEADDTTDKNYGIVIDIGTTTLVASLIDCLSGEELCSVSALNPQCKYAQDVVSRINYADNDINGLYELYSCEIKEFNKMINKLCKNIGIEHKYIYEVVYSGNTTMLHLATNTNPHTLGKYPYTSAIKGGEYITAEKSGLNISHYGRVYLPPIISAYVGADITSGALACNIENLKGNTLFIDIGTNGEMILSSNGRMTATSTAAGPAFEGMNISFGMRAENGAVEYFEITDDFDIIIKTIGNATPIGICGSGLFDITAELVRVGIIENNGKIIKPNKSNLPNKLKQRIQLYNEKPAFKIADNVYITQFDIRQIQLAKAAVKAGIDTMLKITDTNIEEINRVIIAGSFGYHLSRKSLVNIGVIEQRLKERIDFAGNTSKTGGIIFLLNVNARKKMKSAVKQITAIDLSEINSFEEIFIKNINF